MNYIKQAINLLPGAVFTAVIIYLPFIIYSIVKKKKWTTGRHLINYVFIGYISMLVIVTFFIYHPFWFGIRSINLLPFRAFYDAYVQGSSNVFTQYILNIIMFIPLGLMLPLVFPKIIDSWIKTAATVLLITVGIEIGQYVLGRILDIDDIITNFLGGMMGFSIYNLLEWLFDSTRLWKNLYKGRNMNTRMNHVIAFLFIIAAWAGPAAAYAIDAASEFGRIPEYYFRLPEDSVIQCSLDSSSSKGKVYKTIMKNTPEQIMKSLMDKLKQSGNPEWTPDNWFYGMNNQEVSISVFNNGTYHVRYINNADVEKHIDAVNSSDEKCTGIALKLLKDIGIDVSQLDKGEVSQVKAVFEDSNGSKKEYNSGKRITFEIISDVYSETRYFTGNVVVTLGDKDVVKYIEDSRQYHEFLKEVQIISAERALELMRKINKYRNEVQTKSFSNVVVTSVKPDVAIEGRKGHLLPAWRVEGTAVNQEGQEIKWSSLIDAIK